MRHIIVTISASLILSTGCTSHQQLDSLRTQYEIKIDTCMSESEIPRLERLQRLTSSVLTLKTILNYQYLYQLNNCLKPELDEYFHALVEVNSTDDEHMTNKDIIASDLKLLTIEKAKYKTLDSSLLENIITESIFTGPFDPIKTGEAILPL